MQETAADESGLAGQSASIVYGHVGDDKAILGEAFPVAHDPLANLAHQGAVYVDVRGRHRSFQPRFLAIGRPRGAIV